MTSLWTRRGILLGAPLFIAAAGCGTIGDLIGGILGGGDTSEGNIYFVVYNYYSKSVKANVSFVNESGQTESYSVLYNSLSKIPPDVHATLSIPVEDFTGPSDADITVTLTFPDDANATTTLTIPRSDLNTEYRARIGVFDPNTADSFVEGPDA
jgi:hypothetical protein